MSNDEVMTDAEYLENHGTRCPYCGGTELEADEITAGVASAHQEVRCRGCHKCWRDVYRLTGWERMDNQVYPTSSDTTEERLVCDDCGDEAVLMPCSPVISSSGIVKLCRGCLSMRPWSKSDEGRGETPTHQ